MGPISFLSFFKTIGGIESGPEALWGFKLKKSFLLPGVKIKVWCVEGKELIICDLPREKVPPRGFIQFFMTSFKI